MAHLCPECGCRCHCGGDIDDLVFENTLYEAHCQHCPYDDDDWTDEDDEEWLNSRERSND